MRHPSSSPLLPLAFGERSKSQCAGLADFAAMLEASGYDVLDVGVPGGIDRLAVKTAFVAFPSATLLAVSSSAHHVVTRRADRVSLCFGVEGSGTLQFGRSAAVYRRATGVLVPNCPTTWRIDALASDFEVSLDRRRLTATARAMLGLDDLEPLPGWNLDEFRTVPARAGVVEGLATLIGIAIQADRYQSERRVLEASGLEDQCYRHAVFLLIPEAFQRPQVLPAATPASQATLDRLCEWLRVNLHANLTDMERFSGLTARTLQLMFMKRFDLTPMGWLREQRLLAARRMLDHSLDKDPATAIDEAARACGFGSSVNLCKRYRSRFGESPRRTLLGRNVPDARRRG